MGPAPTLTVTRRLVLTALVLLSITACCDEAPRQEPAQAAGVTPAIDPAERVRARTARRFGACGQLMPGNVREDHLPSSLAPLMLVKDRIDGQWGAVGPTGVLEVSEQPVVYHHVDQALAAGRRCNQHDYHWWHRAGKGAPWLPQGVRITVDEDDFPMVWEVLADDTGLRVLYVSEKLERRARQRHGEPLAGRAYVVERSTDETPGVVVARALTDGPVPMGPWVYMESGSGEVTTLICRCMPSQSDGPLVRTDYRLLEWNELSGRLDPWPPERADAPPGRRLDGWLRWP